MLVLFTQRSLGKLLGSRSHGRRRLGPPDFQIRHKRPGWPQEVWLYLPPCPFSGPDGRLPSLWAPLTPPKPAHPAVTHWTPQDFQCHSPKLFPTQKESSVPSDFWQSWKSRSSGLSLMAGLCFAFWKEFAFCPKLPTQPWKTFLEWWSFRRQSPDRDFSGRNKRISPEPAVLWPLLCAAHTGGSSWRHLALTPKEVTKCPTPWLLAYLKIKMGLQGPGIHTLCH